VRVFGSGLITYTSNWLFCIALCYRRTSRQRMLKNLAINVDLNLYSGQYKIYRTDCVY
jgi:hypothetical protein